LILSQPFRHRLEVYGYGVSDARADVGSNVIYWWKLRYDYDDVIFDDAKGTVTIGGASATWNSAQSRWERTVTLPSTPQSYSQILEFTDSTYGLTVITGTTSQSVIADRLEIYWAGASDTRINVGDSTEIRFKVRYDYDDVTFDSSKGTLSIGGVSATWDDANGYWKATITHPSTVTSTIWNVNDVSFTDNTYGLTVKTGSASVTVITDRIRIDSIGVVDGRIDIGSQGIFYATASLEYDDHPLGAGDSLTLGGYVFTWVEANGRFEYSVTKTSVQALTIDSFTSGSEATYGITVGNINSQSGTIIWDRIEIVSVSFSDDRINVGGTTEVRYKLRYDYDDVIFDSSKGSVAGFTWDAANGWWKKTVTGSSSVASTNWDENDISFTDDTYGLTAIEDDPGANLITDRIEIYCEELSDSRVDVGSSIEFRVKARLAYDNHELGSGDSLTANFGALTWDDVNGWFEGSRSQSTVGDYTFTVVSGSEATYGITAIHIAVSNPTGVWDRVQVTLSVPDVRINVGDDHGITYSGVYEYDGSTWTGAATLNDTATSYDTVGKRGFRVASITDPTYGLTVFTTNEVYVIWDRVNINSFSVADSRINVGATAEFTVAGVYEYDGTAWSGTYTLNDTATKSAVGKYGYRVVSITDDNYGLTAFIQTAPDISVIFDKLSITLSAPDDRINVGSTATINVDIIRLYDSSVSGATATLNDTLTKNVVGKYGYTVTSVSGDEYGITIFDSNSISIIFDRVQVTLTVSDSRIDVGSDMPWDFTAVYAYDSADAKPYITVNLNDTATKNSVGKWTFQVASVTDSQYGLTVFETNSIECIWDKLSVTLSVDDSRCDVGSTRTVSWVVTRQYDSSTVTDFSITIYRDAAAFYSGVSSSTTDMESTVSLHNYTCNAVTDNIYGLTVFTSNAVNIIWDKVVIDQLSVADNRINIGDTASFTVSGYYAYDSTPWSGTYSLNDTASKGVVGKYGYRVESITDDNYGLTVFQQTAADLYVIFDRIEVYYMALDDSRVDVGVEVQFRVKARLAYDGHELGGEDSLSANFGVLSWNSTDEWFEGNYSRSTVGDYTFTIDSGNEATYGITAIYLATTEPTGIWDQVEVSIEAEKLQNSTQLPYYFMPEESYALLVKAWYAYDGSSCNGTAQLEYNGEVLDMEALNSSGYAWIKGLVPNVESFQFTARVIEDLYGLENATAETAIRHVNYLTISGFGAYGPPSELDIGWTMSVAHGVLNYYQGVLYVVDNGTAPLNFGINVRHGNVELNWLWLNDSSLWYGDPFQAQVKISNYYTETIYDVNIVFYLTSPYVTGYIDVWNFTVSSIAPSSYAVIQIEGILGGNSTSIPPQRSYPLQISYELKWQGSSKYSGPVENYPLILTVENVTVRDAYYLGELNSEYVSFTWSNLDCTSESYWLIQIVDMNGLTEHPQFIQMVGAVTVKAIGGTLTLDIYLVETGQNVTARLHIENYRSIVFTGYATLNLGFKVENIGDLTIPPEDTKDFYITFQAPSAPMGISKTYVVEGEVYDSSGYLWLKLTASYDVLNNPPIIKLITPTAGSIINGTVAFDFRVEDDGVGVAAFQIRWGHQASWTTIDPPYDFEWDTRSVDDGRITLYVRAYDLGDRLAEKEYYFYVRNGEITSNWATALRNLIEQVSKIAFVPTIILAGIIMLIGFVTGYALRRRPKQPQVVAVPIVISAEDLKKLQKQKK